MSIKQFHTPGFMRMANFALGNPLNPVATGQLQRNGQIDAGDAHREIVLDKERERSHYFDGKLLKAQDLLRDQNYLDARLRQAGRAFGAGIIAGLKVELRDGELRVGRGLGISPSGRVLELRQDELRAPVNDPALRQALNRGQHGFLNTGLYLVLLSWHEAPNDEIAEIYPREASVQPEAQPDAYDQGVVLQLLALPFGLPPVRDTLQARAALAPQFLAYSADFPGMPADSLALGLLAVRDNQAQWLDGPLVRRDYRQERLAHAERLRHSEQYGQLLSELVRQRHADDNFELNRYFRSIPAMGPLANAMVDVDAQFIGGFPDHYEINLVPVRRDDIDFLREHSAHLPPMDLNSRKVERVQILVPLTDSAYETLVAGLEAEASAVLERPEIERNPLLGRVNGLTVRGTSLSRNSAFDSLAGTRLRIRLPRMVRLPAQTAWRTALATVERPLGLLYMREFQLSAIQPPQVLRISEGFAAPPAVTPTDDTGTTTPTPETPIPTPTPEAPTIVELIQGRGSRDERAVSAIERLRGAIQDSEQAVREILKRMDNAYDRFFWITLASSSDPAGMIKAFQQALSNDTSMVEAAVEIGRVMDVEDELVANWKRLGEVLGDLQ